MNAAATKTTGLLMLWLEAGDWPPFQHGTMPRKAGTLAEPINAGKRIGGGVEWKC